MHIARFNGHSKDKITPIKGNWYKIQYGVGHKKPIKVLAFPIGKQAERMEPYELEYDSMSEAVEAWGDWCEEIAHMEIRRNS